MKKTEEKDEKKCCNSRTKFCTSSQVWVHINEIKTQEIKKTKKFTKLNKTVC